MTLTATPAFFETLISERVPCQSTRLVRDYSESYAQFHQRIEITGAFIGLRLRVDPIGEPLEGYQGEG